MAEIILPRRFKAQPQYPAPIDYGGLGKGIQLLFNPAAGPVDLATGRVWTRGGSASVSVGQRGKSFSLSSAGDYYGYTGYPEITSNVGTFFIWLPRVGAADTNGHVYFGASSPAVAGHQINANGQIIIGTGSGGSSGILTGWFGSTNRSLVLVSGGTTGAGNRAYVDGVDTGFTWGNPPTAWGAGNKNFNFGRYVGAAGFQFTGSILALGMTSAVWGAAEAKAFHQNPFALFKAPARRIWAASVGGTTHDLVGSDATQPNAASTGAITQAHALSAQPSVQANSVSADAISQAHALVDAASMQANTATSGAISQGAQFAADPATQPNTAGTGAITQAHALIGASSTQPNTASAASITQVHVLVGAGVTQPNTAAQGAISQGIVHDLAAAASTQANTGTTGAITQAHTLVLAPSVQDNIAAASAIVLAHVLAAASVTQSNSASSGAITAGDSFLVSIVERTATFQRSKSVTVRFN